MRHIVPVVLLLGSLAVAAAPAAAQTTSSTSKPVAAKSTKPASAAEHSIKGVVKSIDASSLTLTSGKKDVTFALSGSTQREGELAAGTTVSVRYHEENGSKVAMAVVAAKAPAPKTSTSKK